MGTPVIYCSKCQGMIPPVDITSGRMVTAGGKNYCAKCGALFQPPASPPVNGPSSGLTGKMALSQAPPRFSRPPQRTSAPGRPTSAPISRSTPPLRREEIGNSPVSAGDSVGRPVQRPLQKPISGLRKSPSALSGKPPVRPTASPGQFRRPQLTKPVKPAYAGDSASRSDYGEDEEIEMMEKKSSSLKYFIIGGIGVAVIAVVVVIILSSGSDDNPRPKPPKPTGGSTTPPDHPEKPPKPSQEERLAKAKKTYDDIIEYENKNPLESGEILIKIKEKMDAVRDTEYEQKLKDKFAEHNAKWPIIKEMKENDISFERSPSDTEYWTKEYTKLKEKAAGLKDSESLLKLIDERLNKTQETKLKQVNDRLKELKDEVTKSLAENAFSSALSSCDSFFEELKGNATVEDEINKLRAEIKNAEEEYERKKKQEWQVLFDGSDDSPWTMWGTTRKVTADDNTLMLENPTNRDTGAAFIGETSWQDVMLEIEYKVAAGAFTLILRADYQDQKNLGKSYVIPFPQRPGDDAWKKITVRIKGSEVSIKEEGKADDKKTLPTGTPASGAVGVQLKSGDKIFIKSVRAKLALD